jgi:hypothetical protein
MSRKTLFACESPWATDSGTLVDWSMQPFLHGLAMLHNFRLLYRTFTSGAELRGLLSSEFPNGDATSKIAYIGSHGYGARLSPGFGTPDINLKSVAGSVHRHIEGVWVSACEVGSSDGLREFLLNGRAVWAAGYTCELSWESAMLIDLAVMNVVMSPGHVDSKATAVGLIAKALRAFDPNWKVGKRNGEDVSLRDAIHLEARDEVQGSRAQDVTEQLLEKLKWMDTPERMSA